MGTMDWDRASTRPYGEELQPKVRLIEEIPECEMGTGGVCGDTENTRISLGFFQLISEIEIASVSVHGESHAP
jgi:hypothetical protein